MASNSGTRGVAGIYGIRGPSDKIYIGSSLNIGKRWTEHRYELRKGIHHCKYLQRAFNKYGESAFRFELLERAAADSDLLQHMEQQYIDALPSRRRYNSSAKADRPISGPLSESHKKRISNANKGQKRSEETRARMSAYAKARNPDHLAKLAAALTGKSASAETRAKQRAAKIGKKQTAAHIAKVRAAQTTIIRADNKSGFRGVSKDGDKWVARIKHVDKYINLGRFETPEIAAMAIQAHKQTVDILI